MNYKLIGILTHEKLKELGFVEQIDNTDDSVKPRWEYSNDKYVLVVYHSLNISIIRLDSVTDPLKLKIESLFDLEMAIDWIG